MSNFFTIIGVVSTTLISVWAVFKYVITVTYKLDNNFSKSIIDSIYSNNTPNWLVSKSHVIDPKYPEIYDAIIKINGIWVYFSRGERLLTAGWQGKEEFSYIMFPRWHRSKIDKFLEKDCAAKNTIPIMALSPYGTDKLGELIHNPNSEIFISPKEYSDIEDDVKKVLDGKINKTGALLYGKPGTGKTQFVKYLSKKYSLPIYTVYFLPDYNNLNIASMFASIPKNCIILMEDFDNYFNKRNCIIKNDSVKFTFDAIINALDGVYNDYKGVIFIMTANQISKIDNSIKNRPSRFKFVREFSPPDDAIRMKILNNKNLVNKTRRAT